MEKEKMIEAIRMLSETCYEYPGCHGCPIAGEVCDSTIGNEEASPDAWCYQLNKIEQRSEAAELEDVIDKLVSFLKRKTKMGD